MIKDLIILVPDKNTKFGLDGLLSRFDLLKIKEISYDIFIHPLRDPGIYQRSSDFLRPRINEYRFSMVFIDREGCGQEQKTKEEINFIIKTQLTKNGWKDRCEVIVLDPELEVWCWVSSPLLFKFIGWDSFVSVKEFIQKKGLWASTNPKPDRPKEAFEMVLREKRIQRSSSIYKKLAENADINICRDSSFIKLKCVLGSWFPR